MGRAGIVVAWVFLGTALVGCEAQGCDNADTGAQGVCLKSLKRFVSPEETDSAAYDGAGDLIIDGPNGDIHVVMGTSDDEFVVTFAPFVLRAYDTPEEVAAENLASLERSIGPSNGDVLIDVTRPSGSPSTLGADITAELPPSFSGRLRIDQTNGSTNVDFAGAAMGLLVNSENGSCDLATGGASEVTAHCDNGDMTATIDAVTEQTAAGFSTGNGSITLYLPADSVFSVQAQALAGGTVTTENMPSTCQLDATSEGSKTLSCNGATVDDPVYKAYADGTSLADIVLSF